MKIAYALIMFCLLPGFATTCFGQQEEYRIEFEGQWFDTNPRPGSAHFTQIVGATHDSAGVIFSVGSTASTGVENVAETGSVGALVQEINAQIAGGSAGTLILGTDTFISPEETNSFNFMVDASHSRVSFLTMIAPSADWFVGVQDLELQDASGIWLDEFVLDLMSYDAGTEDGTGFSLSNPATNPRGVVTALDTAEPSGVLFGSGSLARVRFTRVSAAPELGDVNLDGDVNFLDISPFILLLSTNGFQLEADINGDDAVNFLDISAFIALL